MVGGIAFAAWTTGGAGDGSITAGTDRPLAVSGANTAADLVPNTTKSITLTVSNPNPYAVSLTSLAPTEDSSYTSENPGCDDTNADVEFAAATDVSAIVPANGAQTYTVTVSMGVDSVDACKSAVFTQNYTATGASAAS